MHCTAVGVRGFAGTRSLPCLDDLELGQNPLGDEGAGELVQALDLPALASLDLVHTFLGPQGARSLAGSLAGLKSLWLRQNPIGPEGRRALEGSRFDPDELGWEVESRE